MSEPIWKTLIYHGQEYSQFEVSTNGQLRNVNTGTIYKQHLHKNGYWQVCVSLGDRSNKKVIKIHRAVAETFVSNPDNKDIINHIDGNKQNNVITNLEWVTCSENVQHAYDNGLSQPLRGINNPSAKLTEEDVLYIREHYIPRDREYGARSLGRKFGVDKNSIVNIANYKAYINV